jgi:uncharacterized membrane protein YdfJ with MMPL/SSD domain
VRAALRGAIVPDAQFPGRVRVFVGGGAAQGVDFRQHSYRAFPWLVLAVLAPLLLRAFRSLLLPLKVIVLNLLSVSASYGMLVVFFRWGLGARTLGLYRFSQIEDWIPIFLFALLFGLSMDYEVFLVTRMREAWDAGLDNRTPSPTDSSAPAASSPPRRPSWSPPSPASSTVASPACRSSGSDSPSRSSSTQRSCARCSFPR